MIQEISHGLETLLQLTNPQGLRQTCWAGCVGTVCEADAVNYLFLFQLVALIGVSSIFMQIQLNKATDCEFLLFLSFFCFPNDHCLSEVDGTAQPV